MKTQWSKQSQRLWDFLQANPNREFDAPALNRVAAGSGQYVSSISKRISEVRSAARNIGCDLLKTKDEWVGRQRQTGYTFFKP